MKSATKSVISSTEHKSVTYYRASDVFTSLGLKWDGQKSLVTAGLKNKVDYDFVKGTKVNHNGVTCNYYYFGLTKKGLAKLQKQNKKVVVPVDTATVTDSTKLSTAKEIEKLKEQLSTFKNLFAASLTINKALLTPPTKFVEDNADMDDREAIRTIVNAYASAKCTELGINGGKDAELIHELMYKKLYSIFHQTNGVDIQNYAAASKTKTSGLQAAEDLGLLAPLRRVAETLLS